MARRSVPEDERSRRKPATTPEAREIELISLATDLAEEQLRSGTASSQVITSLIKAGSSRERLEQAKLKEENEFLRVKRENAESEKRVEVMYKEAMDAFRSYSGHDVVDQDVED